jgi:hypothetical protein
MGWGFKTPPPPRLIFFEGTELNNSTLSKQISNGEHKPKVE